MEKILAIAACTLLFAAGYLIRDGWPATGYTNRGARPLGALLCGAGTFMLSYDFLLAGFWAIVMLLSFYTDQKHAKGQNAKTNEDFAWLAVSGVTSILPQTIFGCVFISWDFLSLIAVGLAKPLIWDICWNQFYRPTAVKDYWTQPTRMAAILFGAFIGLIIAIYSK